MPPPGHEPLLRAICETPDDDAPRLVYADWLEEHGDADRAEFIRMHVQLARDPYAPGLEQRCEELFRQHWPRWVAELPDTAILWAEMAFPWGSYLPLLFDSHDRPARTGDTWEENVPSLGDWHRGFPVTVNIQGHVDPFLSSAHLIAEYVPVRRVRLRGLDDPDSAIRMLAGKPVFGKLRELFVKGMFPSDHAAVYLAGSRYATGLRFVSLKAGRMTDRAAVAFAESPFLEDLEMLHLTHNSFSDAARDRLRARFGFRVHC
ncbi:MAG TPA: TIGR02996 domain-containing protein [Gemmataceae bacterium]|nr:TIGR02996 domain-containing protein [Gemmataceae bacterium]